MRGMLTIGTGLALMGLAGPALAQTSVRAPFVQVDVGAPGIGVRAPFVNLWIPSSRPAYYLPPPGVLAPPAAMPAPNPAFELPPPTPMQPLGNPNGFQPPLPTAPGNLLPPTPEEFLRNFQPKPGNYEVKILNPITKAPNTVRFTLPEGTPRRVIVNRRNIEFNYGPRQYVRIEFDRDGAEVTTR